MSGTVVQCPTCGKTITPEEIEIGTSLVCPVCDPAKAKTKNETEQQPRAREDREGN